MVWVADMANGSRLACGDHTVNVFEKETMEETNDSSSNQDPEIEIVCGKRKHKDRFATRKWMTKGMEGSL